MSRISDTMTDLSAAHTVLFTKLRTCFRKSFHTFYQGIVATLKSGSEPYCVWPCLESKVGRINHANALKSAVQRMWDKMPVDFVSDGLKAMVV